MSLLVVEHQATCPPARLGQWLVEAGVTLDLRRPYDGDRLPEDLDGHDGLLVLGGEMGCHDDEVAPWLPTVRELVRSAARNEVPTLGVCLGHQLATIALGGEVAVNPRGRTVGLRTVCGTASLADDPVLAATAGGPVVQWNNDIVTHLPDGAVALADNEDGDLLLARLAPTVWGVQGHPEADLTVVTGWAVKDSGSPAVAHVDLPAVLGQVEADQPRVDLTWRPVAQAFAALLRRG